MTKRYPTLGSAARGTIQARDDQKDRLEEFLGRLADGEFHRPVAESRIPVRCVDGRSPAGVQLLAPNAAGGSESLFVADDLTVKKFASNDESILGGYRNALEYIQKSGQEVGGHTDSHAYGAKSGCGANDRLDEIYAYMSSQGDVLRDLAQTLGIVADDTTHELIMRNASRRTAFATGAEVFDTLSHVARPELIDTLEGEHNEVGVVINKRAGRTLDRHALAEVFGSNYQAFNADVWAFKKAAEIGSESSEESYQKLGAMVYYNLATAMVLAGPSLQLIILE